jgi:hypothetical protein
VTAPGARAQNGRRADERWPGPFGDELRSLVRENLRRFKRRPIRLTAERRRAGVAVAVLDDILPGTGFIITPIVVFVEAGAGLRRMTDEVHSLHRVGLAWLIAPGMPSWARDDSGPEVLQYRVAARHGRACAERRNPVAVRGGRAAGTPHTGGQVQTA